MYKKRSSVQIKCGSWEARKFNIAAQTRRAIRVERKISEIFYWKPVLQPTENRNKCDKSEYREASTGPLEGRMPEVGALRNKITRRSNDAPVGEPRRSRCRSRIAEMYSIQRAELRSKF